MVDNIACSDMIDEVTCSGMVADVGCTAMFSAIRYSLMYMPSGDCSSGFMSPEGIYTDIYPNIGTDIYTGKTRENIK